MNRILNMVINSVIRLVLRRGISGVIGLVTGFFAARKMNANQNQANHVMRDAPEVKTSAQEKSEQDAPEFTVDRSKTRGIRHF